MCVLASGFFFVFFGLVLTLFLGAFKVKNPLSGFIISFLFTFFIFFQQIMYPKMIVNKRIKGIERNLLTAMQNVLIQLNSGVPLFHILVSIAQGDYKEVSEEIGKAVREINAGRPQIEALEEIATTNPSLLFRRALWQIVNGMKSGSDMAGVINESINYPNGFSAYLNEVIRPKIFENYSDIEWDDDKFCKAILQLINQEPFTGECPLIWILKGHPWHKLFAIFGALQEM